MQQRLAVVFLSACIGQTLRWSNTTKMPPSKKLKLEPPPTFEVALQGLTRYPGNEAPSPASIHSNRIALLPNQVATHPMCVCDPPYTLPTRMETCSSRHLAATSASPRCPHAPTASTLARKGWPCPSHSQYDTACTYDSHSTTPTQALSFTRLAELSTPAEIQSIVTASRAGAGDATAPEYHARCHAHTDGCSMLAASDAHGRAVVATLTATHSVRSAAALTPPDGRYVAMQQHMRLGPPPNKPGRVDGRAWRCTAPPQSSRGSSPATLPCLTVTCWFDGGGRDPPPPPCESPPSSSSPC